MWIAFPSLSYLQVLALPTMVYKNERNIIQNNELEVNMLKKSATLHLQGLTRK